MVSDPQSLRDIPWGRCIYDLLGACQEQCRQQGLGTGTGVVWWSISSGHCWRVGTNPRDTRAAVTADEKLSEIAEMVLTHPISGASFTKSSCRCSHLAEGGTSERDLRDERGGPFHPRDR